MARKSKKSVQRAVTAQIKHLQKLHELKLQEQQAEKRRAQKAKEQKRQQKLREKAREDAAAAALLDDANGDNNNNKKRKRSENENSNSSATIDANGDNGGDGGIGNDQQQQQQQQQQGSAIIPKFNKKKKAANKSKKAKIAKMRIPYTKDQKILVVGDGNFSFSRALARRLKTGKNITATSYDTEAEVKQKYDDAEECISEFLSMGGTVHHGIDATKLDTYDRSILEPQYDRIIFNFPHSGVHDNDSIECIDSNRILLRDFFACVTKRLHPTRGEVHVTLKDVSPYDKWDIVGQAFKNPLLRLKAKTDFDETRYPGYTHKCTTSRSRINNSDNNTISNVPTKTYVFAPRNANDAGVDYVDAHDMVLLGEADSGDDEGGSGGSGGSGGGGGGGGGGKKKKLNKHQSRGRTSLQQQHQHAKKNRAKRAKNACS